MCESPVFATKPCWPAWIRPGLCASAASACQSGAAAASHVLEAMGYGPGRARECLRFSFGWTTRPGEGAAAARLAAEQAEALR